MTGFHAAPERPVAAVPAAPARFAVAALAAGIVAAATVADNRVGLNALLVALAIGVAAAAAGRRTVTAWSPAWALLALPLTCVALVRDASWVVLPCLVAAAAFASLAVTGGRTWVGVARGLVAAFERLPLGPPEVARSAASGLPSESRAAAAPALRGIAITAALLTVFGALFISGDQAFAELAEGALPSLRTDLLAAQLFWLALVATFCGALAVAARGAARDRDIAQPRRRLGRAEWVIALGALDLLFAAFVAVQAAVLFGRDEHVLETAGLTYAEYAREGFGQLLVVAALTLAVTAAALRWVDTDRRSDRRLLRALLTVLSALTLVVLASALHRLDLYQDAFGATRLRLAAEASLLWLGGALLVLGAGVISGRYGWMPRVAVLLSGAGLLGFALSDPDGRIAERNVERFAETGRVDRSYLRGLSADAVPALLELPPSLRAETVIDQHSRLAEGDGWAELNFARVRARDALSD